MTTKKKTAKRTVKKKVSKRTAKKRKVAKKPVKKAIRRLRRSYGYRSDEAFLWRQAVQSFALRCASAKKAIVAADEVVAAYKKRYPDAAD